MDGKEKRSSKIEKLAWENFGTFSNLELLFLRLLFLLHFGSFHSLYARTAHGFAFLAYKWNPPSRYKRRQLVDNEGHLKIAGFGKSWYACEDLTGNVTNYRPPEILMGSSALTVSVDIWSAACTFARIITGKHIFEGDSEIEVLSNIFRMCGTPNEGNWSEGLIQMGFEIPEKIDCCLRSSFVKNLSDTKTAALVDKHAIDLFEKMLVFDPEKRISALDALHHPYFITAPLLSYPKSIPRFPDSHSGFRQKEEMELEERCIHLKL